MNDDFRYSIDLSMAQGRAEKIIECIKRLREHHDIRRFEYTKHLRVAPTEIPHSHPILTLNTQLYNPEEILCEYLHEQMHWYEDILGCAREGSSLIIELRHRYPQAPIKFPEGANDEYSTYLHLLVNWLEIEAASQFMPWERAQEIARKKHYYRWIYRTVLSDWRSLEELFRACNIVPITPAEQLVSKQPQTS
jgi:hypothetical protein